VFNYLAPKGVGNPRPLGVPVSGRDTARRSRGGRADLCPLCPSRGLPGELRAAPFHTADRRPGLALRVSHRLSAGTKTSPTLPEWAVRRRQFHGGPRTVSGPEPSGSTKHRPSRHIDRGRSALTFVPDGADASPPRPLLTTGPAVVARLADRFRARDHVVMDNQANILPEGSTLRGRARTGPLGSFAGMWSIA